MSLYSDGKLKWISSATPCGGYSAPSLADTDHDGIPELILGLVQLDARTGAVKNPGPTPAVYAQMSTAAELDGDVANGMEIIGGGAVVHADGTLYWADAATLGDASPAIGDLDLDGKPDVVFVSPGNHTVTAYDHAGVVMWGPIDVNNGVPTLKGPGGGGPPTIADFDGDGKPDVATAGGYGYLVLRGTNGAVLWQSTVTQDTSSRVTGSSVFDFEGDGAAEAIYNDERDLRVYRGSDGAIRLKLCSTSGTLYENPIVADVDGDNHAEIVVVSNNYAINTCDADVGGGPSSTGFKVIGDAKRRWVTTRRVWNQHTYHVTNIADDMQVPQNELSNWAQPGLNNFRQNVQPSSVFAAPDLVASFLRATYDACPDRVTLLLTVLNQGASGVAAGVPVTFYYSENGTDKVLGTVKLATGLLPGGSTTVSYEWNPTPSGSTEVYAVVGDDGTGTLIVNECNDLNNTSATISVGCPGIL